MLKLNAIIIVIITIVVVSSSNRSSGYHLTEQKEAVDQYRQREDWKLFS